MKKSWIFTGLIMLMICIIGGLFFLKNYYKTPLKSNRNEIKAALLEKADALYDKKEPDFLAKNVNEKQITALLDELDRILVAQNISSSQLTATKQKELTVAKTKIELAKQKLGVQLRLNTLFLAEDFRKKVQHHPPSSVDVAQVFDENAAESSVSSSSKGETSASSHSPLKDIAEKSTKKEQLVAINGSEANAFLIISDTLIAEDLTDLKIALNSQSDKENDPWYQAVSAIFANAEEQLATFETAKNQVEALFDGTAVKQEISKEEFQAVLTQVEAIHNLKRQEQLMEKMENVAEAIGEELLNREFIFENLSDKDGVSFTANQTNANWWTGPITFSVTVKNDSTKTISFSYGRLAILKKAKTFHPSQYTLRSDTERFVVNKGESFTIDSLEFKFPSEALVNSGRGGQLVYLLDKEEISNPTVITIANMLINEKTATSSSSSEEATETTTSLDTVAIQQIREKLNSLSITANSLTDVDIQKLISQASESGLDEDGLIKLICEYLGMDYDKIIADAQKSSS